MAQKQVTLVEIVARAAWLEHHEGKEPTFASKEEQKHAWDYWLAAWELAAKKFGYKPTLKEWKLAKQANAQKNS
jgi:hypothetical protein